MGEIITSLLLAKPIPLMKSYLNFDLLLLPSTDGYMAHVSNSPVGQDSHRFDYPFTKAELDHFLKLIVSPRSNSQQLTVPSTDESASMDHVQFGTRLFETIFAGPVGTLFERSLDMVEGKGQGLRIRVRVDENIPEISILPWEYLYLPSFGRFPALSDHTPIVRYMELAQAEEKLAIRPPLRMLVVVSHPTDLNLSGVEEEWKRLQEALKTLVDRNLIVLERLESATPSALLRRLRRSQSDGEIHILHFIGASYFDENGHVGGLWFETETGTQNAIMAEQLALLLYDHRSLRLIFLSTYAESQRRTFEAFNTVAQTLVRQRMPAVLAMQFQVSNEAAIALSYEFYQALSDGLAVDAAVAEARKAIFIQGKLMEWGAPVLFMRSPDGNIFDDTKIGKAAASVPDDSDTNTVVRNDAPPFVRQSNENKVQNSVRTLNPLNEQLSLRANFDQFVDALLQCQSLSQGSTRDDIVSELPPEIRNNISRRAASYPDVRNIVKTCLNYQDGMKTLLDILHGYEGNSTGYLSVRALLTEL